jgi:hypothetical protein
MQTLLTFTLIYFIIFLKTIKTTKTKYEKLLQIRRRQIALKTILIFNNFNLVECC